MAKTGNFRFDGVNFLLTVACSTPEDAEDVAALIGKMGIDDVQTTQAPVMASNGDNSGRMMKRMVAEEIINWTINNPNP